MPARRKCPFPSDLWPTEHEGRLRQIECTSQPGSLAGIHLPIVPDNKTHDRYKKRDSSNACRNPGSGIRRLPFGLPGTPLVVQPLLRGVTFCRTERTGLIDKVIDGIAFQAFSNAGRPCRTPQALPIADHLQRNFQHRSAPWTPPRCPLLVARFPLSTLLSVVCNLFRYRNRTLLSQQLQFTDLLLRTLPEPFRPIRPD